MKTLDDDFSLHGDQEYDVVIAGAGFCGSMLAVQLARRSPRTRVALVEKAREFGPGLAYAEADHGHLLNVAAGKMSAFPDEPEHFLRWLEEHADLAASAGVTEIRPGAFVPRNLYGRYLAHLLATHKNPRHSRIHREVSGLLPVPQGGYVVNLAGGGFLFAKKVVLALGNFLPPHPHTPDDAWLESTRYIRNPWSAQARAALGGGGNVVILGSGLTALDLLATLQQGGGRAVAHIVSRHGLFAEPHNPAPNPPQPVITADELPLRLRDIVTRIRRAIRDAIRETGDWRPVVDGLRPVTQAIWKSLDPWDQRAFVRHLKPWWDVARHRAAPGVFAVKQELEAAGRVQIHRGRILAVREAADGTLDLEISEFGQTEPTRLRAEALINASGPEVNYARVESPLIRNLLQNGLIQPHTLGFGLAVTPEGQALSASGEKSPGLYVLGSMRKGALWECTAVPELREQAADLAALLGQAFAAPTLLKQ
jgi:uncharacterized NAD(P)/FAD-binding protein YdhS